jgi:hypothetical protein
MEALRRRGGRLFLDMDSVFCDFTKGLCEQSGILFPEYERNFFKRWNPVMLKNGKDAHFFSSLPMMHDADKLWKVVKQFLRSAGQTNPIFLTGCPKTPFRVMAGEGKALWVQTNLLDTGLWYKKATIHTLYVPEGQTFLSGSLKARKALETLLTTVKEHDIVMIFCTSDDKHFFSVPLSDDKVPILLDDREPEKTLWEAQREGIYLRHEFLPNLKNDCKELYSELDSLSSKAVGNSILRLKELEKSLKKPRRQTRRKV